MAMRLLANKVARRPAGSACRAPRRAFRTAPRPVTIVQFATKPAEADASGVISGEWSPAWSLASYEDLNDFYAREMCKDSGLPTSMLAEVMEKDVKTVSADMSVESVKTLLMKYSGCPVVDKDQKLVGVVSRRDVVGKSGGSVRDIMSTPPVAAAPTAKVADAVQLMLKHRMSRIPVVDKNSKVVGIISKSDVFPKK